MVLVLNYKERELDIRFFKESASYHPSLLNVFNCISRKLHEKRFITKEHIVTPRVNNHSLILRVYISVH